MTVLQQEQVQQLLISATGLRHEVLYFLAISTGMRVGEILGLKWSDLDWNRSTLHIQRQVQRVDGQGLIFSDPKTQYGNRVIAIGPDTLEKLLEQKQRVELDKAVAGDRWKENDLVFPSSIGSPQDPHNLRKEFVQLLEKSGLPKIRFHDLRHTSITLILNDLGAPIKEAQHRAGHASPSTTINIYCGTTTTKVDEEVARGLDALIKPVKIELHPVAPEEKSLPSGRPSDQHM